jgi:protoporphyrinogen/coproporphyrinogen III oxidase
VAGLLKLTVTSDVDVIVVGGGAAGLAAASALDHRDLVLLEAEDRLGGRLHSLARGEVWLNLGAHLLTGGDSIVKRLMAEAGVDVLAVPGTKTALWFGGRLHDRRRVEAYPLVLPLTLRERLDLIRCGSMLRVGVERWRRAAHPRRGESEASHSGRLRRYRSARTLGQRLQGVSPRVASIFETAARRSAGEADRLTEGGAMALFGALWVSGDSASVVNVAGGSGRFGEAWQQRLGSRAVTGARVTTVVEQSDHVEVTFKDREGGVHRLRARHVVVAVPASGVTDLVAGLPAEVRHELNGVEYGPFVCLGILTTALPPLSWDGIYAIATPGAEFDMLFHHSNPVVAKGGDTTSARSLMCYAGGDKAAALMDLDDDEIRCRFLAQVRDVLPEVGEAVAETVVMKWRDGNCYPTPGASLDAVERWNHRPGARVVLAGDYFAPLGGTVEAAARSGLTSAGMLRSAGAGPALSGHRSGSRERTHIHD